jgi:hypothetical protein
MRKRMGIAGGLLLLACGCAPLMKSAPSFAGQFLTISIEPVVAFPPEVTLDGFHYSSTGDTGETLNNAFLTDMGDDMKKKAGALIAAQVQPYTAALIGAFKDEIVRRGIYKGVVDQGGDVRLRLTVLRYGLVALSGSGLMKPVLEVKGDLLLGGLGVVWTRTFAVDEKSGQTMAVSLADLVAGPGGFQKGFGAASTEAAQGVLAELK